MDLAQYKIFEKYRPQYHPVILNKIDATKDPPQSPTLEL